MSSTPQGDGGGNWWVGAERVSGFHIKLWIPAGGSFSHSRLKRHLRVRSDGATLDGESNSRSEEMEKL